MLRISLVKLRVKAIRVGNSIRVAIPSDVLKASEIKEGDNLLVDYDEKLRVVTIQKED